MVEENEDLQKIKQKAQSQAIRIALINKVSNKDVDKKTENKAEKEDVIFYADPQEKICGVLNSGDFAIFFRWVLHRPNCSVEKTASNVQKIVVKVKA